MSLADNIRILNNDLRTELEKMNDGLHHLGATWQDEEFKKFRRVFDQLKEDLEKLNHEISNREPQLREDAQILRDFLSKQPQ